MPGSPNMTGTATGRIVQPASYGGVPQHRALTPVQIQAIRKAARSSTNKTPAAPAAGGAGAGGGVYTPTPADYGYTWDPLTGLPTPPGVTQQPGSSVTDPSLAVPNQTFPGFKPTAPSRIDPSTYTKLMGNPAFAPLIAALTGQKAALQGGIGQANQLIDNAGATSQATAQEGQSQILGASQKTNQGLTDLAARMVSAAGGDPTAASAVGAVTGNAEAAGGAQAATAATLEGDKAAAAIRDAASQKLAYRGANDQLQSDLATKIGTAKLQGSQASGQALSDVTQANDQLQTAGLARDSARQNAYLTGRLGAAQATAADLANGVTRQGTALAKHGADMNDWTSFNATQRAAFSDRMGAYTSKQGAEQIKQQLQSGRQPLVLQALINPTGPANQNLEAAIMAGQTSSKTGPLQGPVKTYDYVVSQLTRISPGAKPAAIKALAAQYTEKTLAGWNAAHPGFQYQYDPRAGTYVSVKKK